MKPWEKLYSRRTFGIKLGLDVEAALLEELGNPEKSLKCVHVAGTNGKGSVCAIIQSILREAGLKAGLYTSPHLVDFNERFIIGRHHVDDAALLELVGAVETASESAVIRTGQEATFFECSTAIALKYFADSEVDIAVIETGMGGRLDATNVIRPLVSVITRISLEHTEHLGGSVREIAGEKAGIIKAGVPVVAGVMDEDSKAVIAEAARKRKSPLIDVADNVSVTVKNMSFKGTKVSLDTRSLSYGTLNLALAGAHQVENLAAAAAVIDVLRDFYGMEISDDNLKKGAERVEWPGRMQLISDVPPVVLDGAHNPSAARSLAGNIRSLSKGAPVSLVLGMCNDKDYGGFLSCFRGIVRKVWTVPIAGDRNAPAADLAKAASDCGFEVTVCDDLYSARSEAEQWAVVENGIVCITGSLFLVGDVLKSER